MKINPKNLDILLVSNYGQKKIGPVARQFSNNVGVIIDKVGLANLIKDLYWEPWIKSYNALDYEYGITDNYHINKSIDQSDNRDIKSDISETGTKSGNINKTNNVHSNNGTNISYNDDSTLTFSGTDINTSGKDYRTEEDETKNLDTNYTDDQLKSSVETEYHIINSKDIRSLNTTNHEYGEISNKSGDDTVTNKGGLTSNRKDYTNFSPDKDIIIPEDIGIQHDIIKNHTDEDITRDIDTDEKTPPYDTDNLKTVAKNHTHDHSLTNTNNDLDEHTLELSFNQSKSTDTNNSESKTIYNSKDGKNIFIRDSGNITDSHEFQDLNLVKNLDKYVISKNTHDHGSSNESVIYGKKETNNVDGSKTISVNNNENVSESGTTSEDTTLKNIKSETDDLVRNIVSKETGNNGSKTNQELITQELELRRNNIYNKMISDVVKLITLSIY